MAKAAVNIEVDHNDPLVRYNACKAMAKGFAESIDSEEQRIEHARTFCASVISSYWQILCKEHKTRIKIQASIYLKNDIELDVLAVANDTGELIATFVSPYVSII